jgi:inhibitor of KinA sporulation pathway (predicted exonuclease)
MQQPDLGDEFGMFVSRNIPRRRGMIATWNRTSWEAISKECMFYSKRDWEKLEDSEEKDGFYGVIYRVYRGAEH